MSSPDLFELARELTRLRLPHAWITVITVSAPSSSYVGAQAIVKSDGEMTGWIGGGCVQGIARAAALRAIASATPQRLRLSNTTDPGDAIDVRPMACASNGEVELFIQPAAVAPRLRIYGKTPIAEFAARLAKEMDFDPLTDTQAEAKSTELLGRETDPPDRETYALIATQGGGDEAALEAALHSNARAVLVIASPRKTARLREAMELRGIARERLGALQAPAGPDIGAVTPNEIALSAIAGLVALRRGHSPHIGNSNAPGKRTVTSPASDANTLGATVTNPAGITGTNPAGTTGTSPAGHKPRPRTTSAPDTGYINPVCGAVVDPAHAVSTLTLRGQTHYFCCQGCRTEFERDPDKYLEIGARMRPKPSDASAPTHP